MRPPPPPVVPNAATLGPYLAVGRTGVSSVHTKLALKIYILVVQLNFQNTNLTGFTVIAQYHTCLHKS